MSEVRVVDPASISHDVPVCVCVCRCWISESPYTIVLIIPVCASMVLNLIFLCNILRVLLIKLRAGPHVGSSRPSSTLLQVCLLPTYQISGARSSYKCLFLHYTYFHMHVLFIILQSCLMAIFLLIL